MLTEIYKKATKSNQKLFENATKAGINSKKKFHFNKNVFIFKLIPSYVYF